jgi:zinc protease
MLKTKLNRKIPPPIHPVGALDLPLPTVTHLDNGIPVYITQLGTQDIMKLELVVLRGRPYEHKRVVSRATARLIREGTKSFSSAEIAEHLDFYAGTLQTPFHMDSVGATLYCLTKHFPKLIPLLAEMLIEPTYPQHELNTFVDNNVQKLIVELTKIETIAYRKMSELMFGDNTPYGYCSTVEDYRALTTADLEKHHRDNYTADNINIFLSGKFDDSTLNLLNQYLGKIPKSANTPPSVIQPFSMTPPPQKVRVKIPDAMQTAIRIGRKIGNRKQMDYASFFVLNTILGGYFGSRLMSNIREEKGYTYNIYSANDLLYEDGYFYIGSEVGNKFVDKSLTEIYREMAVLQNDLVGEEELGMVKSYLLGNILGMIDGPFAISDVIRTFVNEQMPFSEWHTFIDKIRHIQPTEIRDLAQKYLRKEDMTEVIVGI